MIIYLNYQKKELQSLSESEFWHDVALHIFAQEEDNFIPDVGENPTIIKITIEETLKDYNQTIAITARGSFKALNGAEKPSPFVVFEPPSLVFSEWSKTREAKNYNNPHEAYKALCMVGGNISGLAKSYYETRHLVYCSPFTKGGHGSYKFYQLFNNDDGTVGAKYGRIGGGSFCPTSGERYATPIPSWKFWLRYYEKLAKGYEDVSDVYLVNLKEGVPAEEEATETPSIESQDSLELFELLSANADSIVDAYALCGADSVTYAMVEKSRELIKQLSELVNSDELDAERVVAANKLIVKLMSISPRKANYVDNMLIKDAVDIDNVVSRESALADAMESAVLGRKPTHSTGQGFSSFDIDVRLADTEERQAILNLMIDPYSGKDEGGFIPRVKRIWAIDPKGKRAQYKAYLAENNICEERLLFHGSSFGSWLSCITKGLSLSYAVGGMFGKAHYFANQFRKASGYVDGSWWGRGGARRKLSYIGVYDVAYGKPHKLQASAPNMTKSVIDKYGCNSVHAFRGASLRNDEIMVYSDDACCIKYLIEYES